MTHYDTEREKYSQELQNINDQYTKKQQRDKCIAYLMDCYGVSEQEAIRKVEEAFEDLKC